MNIYSERIKSLQALMKEEKIDLYFIPMDDCHMSEYVADHFKCIEFMSGFTGSAARLFVSADKAFLFTDGRYYIQAASELEGSGIELMKEGIPGVPSPGQLAESLLKDGDTLGFDGNVVNAAFAKELTENIGKNISIKYEKDLVGQLWEGRPAQEFTNIWEFGMEYAGKSVAEKLSMIRDELSEKAGTGKDYLYMISSLDDIAWLFNIRANDIPCNLVAYAYAAVSKTKARLCVNGNIPEDLKGSLAASGTQILPYGTSYICEKTDDDAVILLDGSRTSYSVYSFYKKNGADIRCVKEPTTLFKALKNGVEIKNTKEAYIRDGISIIRFMKWIKDLAKKTPAGKQISQEGRPLSELDVDIKLQELRGLNPDYLGPSFDTIAAYGPNAAMMHYEARPESFSFLKAQGMLLVDSGGQYSGATTDITRTFVLGPLTEDEKKSFTLTAVSMLRLMKTKFIKGCTGENVDIIAREPMWERGLDYKCGTGHGVGCCLNVHEPPHRIGWKITDGRKAPLTEGMFVTDEPGVYKEGAFGVRLENELLVKPFMETKDGTFLQFENMTFIPIDPDGIDECYMTQEDIRLYESYQKKVYEMNAPFLEGELKGWLKEVCEA